MLHRYFFRGRSTVARVANSLQEPAREFDDSIWLPPSDSLSRDQVSSNAQRDCPSGDEAERGSLIHTAGGNQRHVGKHRLKIPDVTVASDVPAGHNFYEIWTQFPRADDAGRGEYSGDHDDVLLHGELHRFWIKPVARKEFSPRIQAAACGFDIVDAAGADNHLGGVMYYMRNYFDRFGHGQRDLNNGYPAAGDRLRGEKRILSRGHANRRNNPEFFDPASYVLLVQRSSSLGDRRTVRRMDFKIKAGARKPAAESG
jgi:hypothetical protein